MNFVVTIAKRNPAFMVASIGATILFTLYKNGKLDSFIDEANKKGGNFKKSIIEYYTNKGVIIGMGNDGKPVFDAKMVSKELAMYAEVLKKVYGFYKGMKM